MTTQTLQLGMTASRSMMITNDTIQAFADLSGDRNPVHMDEAYAATTRFGKRIAHGMISAALISAVLGNDLPGTGAIYLSQSLQFKAPVFPGDTITATATVKSLRADKPLVTITTTCTKQDGTVVVEGEAVLLYNSR